MSGCIRGREVTVAIRKGGRGKATRFNIVCPARWTKAGFLRYVRAEHPGETVRIVDWQPAGSSDDAWRQRLWLANPNGFLNYPAGVPSTNEKIES